MPIASSPCAGVSEMVSIFKISKKVPLPSDMTLNRKFYPWTELEQGDSFFVRNGKVTALSAKAAWAGRQYGKQYICRTVKGGVRVWCLGDRDPSEPRKHNKRAAPNTGCDIEKTEAQLVAEGIARLNEQDEAMSAGEQEFLDELRGQNEVVATPRLPE